MGSFRSIELDGVDSFSCNAFDTLLTYNRSDNDMYGKGH